MNSEENLNTGNLDQSHNVHNRCSIVLFRALSTGHSVHSTKRLVALFVNRHHDNRATATWRKSEIGEMSCLLRCNRYRNVIKQCRRGKLLPLSVVEMM